MKTYNIRYRSRDKLKDFLFKNEIIDTPDLLIQIFSYEDSSVKIQHITQFLNDLLPSAHIIGTTTDGEILDGRLLTKNIVLSFTLFETTKLASSLVTFEDDDNYKMGQLLAENLIEEETKALILFATSPEINALGLLKGIRSVKEDVVIAGALAGDKGEFKSGYVFDKKDITDRGVVAVSLSSSLLIASNYYTSQWEPVGREFTVTKAKDNRLISVDRLSVKTLYEKYLGKDIAQKLPLSGLQFPFVMKNKNNTYIARSILMDPEDGSLIFGANMKKGDKIQIGFGDASKMLQNSQNLLEHINTQPVESIFVYSASGRRRFLQQQVHYEIEPFSQVAPTSGFYGYGEFYANSNESTFLNQSLTVLCLSEKDTVNPKKIHYRDNHENHLNEEILRALSNIAKVSSFELQELNQKLETRIKEEVAKNRKKDGILIHNSRLAQIGEMMSLIAHQWRQPLSAISATSTGLHVKIELGKYDEKFFLTSLDKIEDYVKHLSATIDDFANFFKPAKRLIATSTTEIIQKALFIMSASLQKHSMEVDIKDISMNPLYTYPNEVIQVLINLVKNAENVLRKRKIQNPKITILSYDDENKHIIEVCDNAGGIDKDIIEQIFEPYFTTKNNEDSTGLGLYMSKFIIEESCKGTLEVVNSQEGAIFRIIL